MNVLIFRWLVLLLLSLQFNSVCLGDDCLAPRSYLQASNYDEYITVTERATGRVVSFKTIKASELDYNTRMSAARSLNRWLKNGGIHVNTLKVMIRLLEDNDQALLSKIYLVLSVDNQVEGWVHSLLDSAYIMEVAPWNRKDTGISQKYEGLGAELRLFFLKDRMALMGKDFFSPANLQRISVLGHRRERDNIFKADAITPSKVLAYIKEQEIKKVFYLQIHLSI